MIKKIYICAHLQGDVENKLRKVKRYAKYALLCGTAPVVPQFYSFCLIPKEREIGLSAGLSLLWFCDEMWIFGDTVTAEMENERSFCQNLNIPIRYIRELDIQKKIGGYSL